MTDKINRLPEFLDAVGHEIMFKYKGDQVKTMYHIYVGDRILAIQNDTLSEDEYIAEWLNQ